jgi:hypothetical protein
MSAIPPLAAPVTPSPGATPAPGETTDAATASTRVPERQIFDYAVELQQAALNDGGRLANPAALVGDVVEGLRGFFERARRSANFTKELEHKSHDGLLTTNASTIGEPPSTLHGGPAQQSLEPIGTDYDRPASSEIDDTGELADRLTDEMLNAAFVHVQARLIAAGTGHISGSVNTLLKGQ